MDVCFIVVMEKDKEILKKKINLLLKSKIITLIQETQNAIDSGSKTIILKYIGEHRNIEDNFKIIFTEAGNFQFLGWQGIENSIGVY